MDDLGAVFRALADPTRRRLIGVLAGGPIAVGALALRLGVSQPTVSQHLKVLLGAGLAESQREGRQRIWALKREGLWPVSNWVGWLMMGGDLEGEPEAAHATVSDADRVVAKRIIREILVEEGGSVAADTLELLAGVRLQQEGMEGGFEVAEAVVAEMVAVQGG